MMIGDQCNQQKITVMMAVVKPNVMVSSLVKHILLTKPSTSELNKNENGSITFTALRLADILFEILKTPSPII